MDPRLHALFFKYLIKFCWEKPPDELCAPVSHSYRGNLYIPTQASIKNFNVRENISLKRSPLDIESLKSSNLDWPGLGKTKLES